MAIEPVTAIDIGGTKIAAARVAGEHVLERLQVATPRTGRLEDMVGAVAAIVPAAWRDGPVGVATTGIVRAGRLSALNPRTLPIPADSPFADALDAALGVPVTLHNDAHAASWGEYRFGAGQGAACMAFLTVSTGVGGGLVDHGRLLSGADGFGGHFGHLQVAMDGEPCGCGRIGCVEALASGTALATLGSRALDRTVDASELITLAREDATARRVLDRAVAAMAALLSNLRAGSGVDVVVMGGGVGLNPAFQAEVARAVAGLPAIFRPVLRPAQLGHDAGLIGAAALVTDRRTEG